jgi:hypothetical protein
MSPAFPNAQRSSADIRWWKDQPSATEIAERLARSHIDKQQLEGRLDELLHENNILKLQCSAAAAELEDEQKRLKGEIDSLRAQLDARQPGEGRHEAEAAARERLLKDEFERKLETLQVELNRERQRSARQLEEIQARFGSCICGAALMEPKPSSPSSGMPKRWVIRHSK